MKTTQFTSSNPASWRVPGKETQESSRHRRTSFFPSFLATVLLFSLGSLPCAAQSGWPFTGCDTEWQSTNVLTFCHPSANIFFWQALDTDCCCFYTSNEEWRVTSAVKGLLEDWTYDWVFGTCECYTNALANSSYCSVATPYFDTGTVTYFGDGTPIPDTIKVTVTGLWSNDGVTMWSNFTNIFTFVFAKRGWKFQPQSERRQCHE
jgi:hypothetical protein